MTKWLVIALLTAAVVWWVSRPQDNGKKSREKSGKINMQQCPNCGVYIEKGSNCDCKNK